MNFIWKIGYIREKRCAILKWAGLKGIENEASTIYMKVVKCNSFFSFTVSWGNYEKGNDKSEQWGLRQSRVWDWFGIKLVHLHT